MQKKSYNNKERKIKKKLKDLPTPSPSIESLTGEVSSGIGRGYVMPGEPTQPPFLKQDEVDLPAPKKIRRDKSFNFKQLLKMMVDLSDELDKKGEYDFANFSDFLIKKIAQVSTFDFSKLFKDLLIKINNSDIHNKEQVLFDLVNKFNKIVSINVISGVELKEAKSKAYDSIIKEVEQYVGIGN